MNNTVINIRVPENLKQKLELIALENNKSCSDLIREGLNDLVNKEQLNNQPLETNALFEYKFTPLRDGVDLLQTLGFTELVFWIMAKQINPQPNESEELYKQFIDLINELCVHKLFTKVIKIELRKISYELESYLYGKAFTGVNFRFAETGNQNSFDFEVFIEFMYGIRYDDDNNRIFHIK